MLVLRGAAKGNRLEGPGMGLSQNGAPGRSFNLQF